jgi:phage shock protein C
MKRDMNNAMIGGICAGIARAIGLSTLLIRMLFVFGLLWCGLTAVIYFLLWALMGVETGEMPFAPLDSLRRQNGVLCGVCGGLAVYLGVSALLLRLLWLFAFLWGGFGLVVYIVLAICIPPKDN